MRLPQDYVPMDGKEVRRIRRGLHFTQVKFFLTPYSFLFGQINFF